MAINFNVISIFTLEQHGDILILPRYANDGVTIKCEYFILNPNAHAGKGAYGTGYLSLGVEQTDEDGNVRRDESGNPILKKE